jgi:phosphatidylinositol alpha-1,6-mannosyltransferase
MRLLALITDGRGADGGIARYNMALLKALSASQHLEHVTALPRFGDPEGWRDGKIDSLAPVSSPYMWAAKAAYLAFTGKYDVIFCGHMNVGPLAAQLARLMRCKLWVQAHGIDAWEDRGVKFRRALANADLVSSVSRYTQARLMAWSGIDYARARTLPNTFNANFSLQPRRADLVARYGLEGRKTILTVGRLASAETYKGHDRIIRCLPMLQAIVPKAAYLIVGGGDDMPRLKALAQETGVQDSVIFAGRVPEDELQDHYGISDVFAMPSDGEGFGIVFLEAAATGIPVVGGNRDGSLDALADGEIGTPVDPHDPRQLTEALAQAIAAPKRASAEALERFSFPHFAAHVDKLVSGLVAESSAR